MGRLFGTDGIRGVANKGLTASLAYEIGRAASYVLGGDSHRPVFIIGRDTRISGEMLENALAAGIMSVGGDVIKLGVMPTPAIARLVRHYEADAGVVISASHNSFEYNGIKIFNDKGFKLDDRIEEEIEDIILAQEFQHPEYVGERVGRCHQVDDAFDVYVKSLLDTIDIRLDGMKIVLDTANGASYQVAPTVYKALGADVTVLSNTPDGVNINERCGSTHPEELQKKVVEVGADVGFAYDGDADRLIVVDDKGKVLDGDYVLCICGKMLKSQGKLPDNKITATVMSNLGVHKFAEKEGMSVDVTGVGDRYVLESMLKTGSVLGGEQSGHMIFMEYTTTGDGVLSSLQFIKAVKESGKTVSQLGEEVVIYPQALVNAKVNPEFKKEAMNDSDVQKRIEEVEKKLEGVGRVLIRPSGTEPLIRVMLEGENTEELKADAEYIAALIMEKFGEK